VSVQCRLHAMSNASRSGQPEGDEMTEPTESPINDREPYESTWAQGRYPADEGAAPDFDPDDEDAAERIAAIERARHIDVNPHADAEVHGED
jgi:hypothetical protein